MVCCSCPAIAVGLPSLDFVRLLISQRITLPLVGAVANCVSVRKVSELITCIIKQQCQFVEYIPSLGFHWTSLLL